MVHPSSFHPVAVPWCWLNSRAQPRCPHHTHCYTETESTDRKIRQRVRECTRVQWILDPALLRTAMLNSLSAFSAFSVASFLPFSFFHDFRWRTDDRRASLAASYRVSEFLEVYSKETEYKISREFMKKIVFISPKRGDGFYFKERSSLFKFLRKILFERFKNTESWRFYRSWS